MQRALALGAKCWRGNAKWNVAPWPEALVTHSRPLYVSMIDFTDAKPTPLPGIFSTAALLARRNT